jgi:hypothetical protein
MKIARELSLLWNWRRKMVETNPPKFTCTENGHAMQIPENARYIRLNTTADSNQNISFKIEGTNNLDDWMGEKNTLWDAIVLIGAAGMIIAFFVAVFWIIAIVEYLLK